ncbi:MAG: insulinase family protein [Phycisphaerales bacterium]
MDRSQLRRAASLAALVLGAAGALAQPLQPDPDLLMGTLDNGMEYIILQHANPPGRVNLMLHLSTGSLNETEETRGIAHFMEHMEFNGGEHIPPGQIIPYFESLAMTFGQHLNAFTSFDQTAYTLSLPDTQVSTLKKGFLFYQDVLFGTLLLQDEIDKERGVILEELRTGKGPDQRIMDQIFEKIAPGSTFGRRLPIGTEETINSVNHDDFVDYHNHWYVPSNATLIVVGDMDPKVVEQTIEETFDVGEKTPRPQDKPVGIKPYTEMRAIVATDPELTEADISLVGVDLPRPPVTSEERFRQELVENLAAQALNRRLGAKINDDKVAFTDGGAFVLDLFNEMRLSQINGSGDPGEWRDILKDLTTELRRARLHGFTERELDDVRKQAISIAERRAEVEKTLPARARINTISGAVASGSTPISGAESLELTRKYAPTITLEEVNKVFLSMFDDQKVTIVAELPSSGDVPTEDELLALGREDLAVTPEAEGDVERPTELLSELPAGGSVVESMTHESSGVTSAWLGNNVRVHHRFMDIQKDQVSVTITLAGGGIEETASNRGVSDAAALAWNRPAAEGLTSTNIRDIMTGKKVGVGGGAGEDAFTLSVSGSPAELEEGMQLAYLLLTHPVIEQSAFDQWQQQQILQIQQSKMLPQGQFMDAMAEAMLPDSEARLRPLTVEQVQGVTREQAQAWLDDQIRSAPIEVSVVGDIDEEAAMALVTRYIGSLPPRERISESTLESERDIQRPEGAREVVKLVETQTPFAIALAGSFGTSMDNVHDRRALNVAAQILTTRLIERVREEEAQVYSIQAISQPGTEYPNLGIFVAFSQTGPENGPRLASVIHEMFATFAESGPSAEEVETARAQILNTYDEQVKQPRFWTSELSALDYRGLSLDEIEQAPEIYQSFTDGDILDTFRRYYTPDTKLTVIVAPKPQATADDAAGGRDPEDDDGG